jgi:rare lipoprotein A
MESGAPGEHQTPDNLNRFRLFVCAEFWLFGSAKHSTGADMFSGSCISQILGALTAAAFLTGFAPADEAGLVTASFYQSGAVTANGEQFRPMGFTAAHRSLKFGTWLKVVNTDNGKSVTVRVNDRGPYVDGRAIDLSLGAALALDMTGEGLAKVQVSVISP